jgi:flagellar basal-body rod modification protein FlgD
VAIDPTSGTHNDKPEVVPEGTRSTSIDKDAFLSLLVTQLKNQDPTDPQKNEEMIAQLATFSSLEQLTAMKTSLEQLKDVKTSLEQLTTINANLEKMAKFFELGTN